MRDFMQAAHAIIYRETGCSARGIGRRDALITGFGACWELERSTKDRGFDRWDSSYDFSRNKRVQGVSLEIDILRLDLDSHLRGVDERNEGEEINRTIIVLYNFSFLQKRPTRHRVGEICTF